MIRELLGGEAESTLTIAVGAVTPTAAVHAIDTEAAAATDDLDLIDQANLADGRFLLIHAANAARTVVVKHLSAGAGQVKLADAVDFPLDAVDKVLLLRRVGTQWQEVFRAFGADKAAARAFLAAAGSPLSAVLDTGGFAIDESEGTAVASAATTDIWAIDGNTVHATGNITITSFGAAPRIGAVRWVIFDGAPLLTHSANLNLQGSANIQIAAGDIARVYADTITQFDVTVFKADGTSVVGGVIQATQAALEAETNEDTYAPPDLIKHNPGVVKVWCVWDMNATIRASLNVSSVTDVAVGRWTINFTTDFSSIHYSSVMGQENASITSRITIQVDSPQLMGSVTIEQTDTTGIASEANSTAAFIICCGDQ